MADGCDFVTIDLEFNENSAAALHRLSILTNTLGTNNAVVFVGNLAAPEGSRQLEVSGNQFAGVDENTAWKTPVLVIQGSHGEVSGNEIRGAKTSYLAMEKGVSIATGTDWKVTKNTILFSEFGIWCANGTVCEDHKIYGNTIIYNDYGVFYETGEFGATHAASNNLIVSRRCCVKFTGVGGFRESNCQVSDNRLWRYADLPIQEWRGVRVDGIGCQVMDNDINSFGGAGFQLIGVHLEGSQFCSVSGNSLAGCSDDILETDAANDNNVWCNKPSVTEGMRQSLEIAPSNASDTSGLRIKSGAAGVDISASDVVNLNSFLRFIAKGVGRLIFKNSGEAHWLEVQPGNEFAGGPVISAQSSEPDASIYVASKGVGSMLLQTDGQVRIKLDGDGNVIVPSIREFANDGAAASATPPVPQNGLYKETSTGTLKVRT